MSSSIVFRELARWGIVTGILVLASLQLAAQCDCAGPCQHCVDGQCYPNRQTFGYYETQWRRWPIDCPGYAPARKARGMVDPSKGPDVEAPEADDEAGISPEFPHLKKRASDPFSAEGVDESAPIPAPRQPISTESGASRLPGRRPHPGFFPEADLVRSYRPTQAIPSSFHATNPGSSGIATTPRNRLAGTPGPRGGISQASHFQPADGGSSQPTPDTATVQRRRWTFPFGQRKPVTVAQASPPGPRRAVADAAVMAMPQTPDNARAVVEDDLVARVSSELTLDRCTTVEPLPRVSPRISSPTTNTVPTTPATTPGRTPKAVSPQTASSNPLRLIGAETLAPVLTPVPAIPKTPQGANPLR